MWLVLQQEIMSVIFGQQLKLDMTRLPTLLIVFDMKADAACYLKIHCCPRVPSDIPSEAFQDDWRTPDDLKNRSGKNHGLLIVI